MAMVPIASEYVCMGSGRWTTLSGKILMQVLPYFYIIEENVLFTCNMYLRAVVMNLAGVDVAAIQITFKD